MSTSRHTYAATFYLLICVACLTIPSCIVAGTGGALPEGTFELQVSGDLDTFVWGSASSVDMHINGTERYGIGLKVDGKDVIEQIMLVFPGIDPPDEGRYTLIEGLPGTDRVGATIEMKLPLSRLRFVPSEGSLIITERSSSKLSGSLRGCFVGGHHSIDVHGSFVVGLTD